ncbi:uncharacterized protein TM35_000101430 [Trypanosoma theileri]|uniref:Leucine-rich repeat protein (LRRP) n=1 Tax=Trypanosoma theileri TaxID=67003 RepID=A0A1X0NYX3_9TRYP|nr:uncharacterized protein TM35_000101430 [Trypanosoma theileri]ORC89875.1 hypothetical protein TM35_000101430 [Trypanosoma theileri]
MLTPSTLNRKTSSAAVGMNAKTFEMSTSPSRSPSMTSRITTTTTTTQQQQKQEKQSTKTGTTTTIVEPDTTATPPVAQKSTSRLPAVPNMSSNDLREGSEGKEVPAPSTLKRKTSSAAVGVNVNGGNSDKEDLTSQASTNLFPLCAKPPGKPQESPSNSSFLRHNGQVTSASNKNKNSNKGPAQSSLALAMLSPAQDSVISLKISDRKLEKESGTIAVNKQDSSKNAENAVSPSVAASPKKNSSRRHRQNGRSRSSSSSTSNSSLSQCKTPREQTNGNEMFNLYYDNNDIMYGTEKLNEKVVSSPKNRLPLMTNITNGNSVQENSPVSVNKPSFDAFGFLDEVRSNSLRGSPSSIQNQEITSVENNEISVLEKYVREVQLDLSFSTFRRIGAILAASRTLRVINLKGCTIENEDLYGLAEIPTLRILCVSHMRQLTSLRPLVVRKNGVTANIEVIDAQCTSIGNDGIIGLGKMRSLECLDLSMTSITDVTPLAESDSLIELNLTATRVTTEGIAGLETMPKLKTLNISRTKVVSLQRISKSTSLENLKLYSCWVRDAGMRGVERMPQLRLLDVSTTKITDLSFLSVSKSLRSVTAQWLALRNCKDVVTERRSRRNDSAPIDFFDDVDDEDEDEDEEEDDYYEDDDYENDVGEQQHEKYKKKKRKNNNNNKGDGEGSVKRQRLLNRKNDNNPKGDQEAGFSGLANIPTLEYVDLSYTLIRSVRSLFKSKSIKTLILRRTRVDSEGIKGIQQLRSLQTLIITNISEPPSFDGVYPLTPSSGVLVSIADIAGILNMVVLDMSFTDVYDLRMLSALKHLRELYLVETLITVDGIRGIERLPSLRILDISQTSVLSLQFLSAGCPVLEKILVKSNRNVRGFRVGNIHILPSLELLDVSDTIVEDIKMLFRPTCRLKQLIWRWGERRDATGPIDALSSWVKTSILEGMECMPQLEYLDLTNTAVSSVSFLAQSKSLKRLILARCNALVNKGILGLELISTLELLDLTYASQITEVRSLCTSPSLCELRLGWTGLTLEGMKGISQIPTLKVLNVMSTPAEEEEEERTKIAVNEKRAEMTMMNGFTSPLGRKPNMVETTEIFSNNSSGQFKRRRLQRVSFKL